MRKASHEEHCTNCERLTAELAETKARLGKAERVIELVSRMERRTRNENVWLFTMEPELLPALATYRRTREPAEET